MRVVCTAGHVDHGKSTVVRALTGMEPDRLEEERRRGLTIDLGFAWTELTTPGQPPQTVAFVDLPGHERFVGTMLAGAGALDLALFVVAADEGWKPQSSEHRDILDLLGVARGVVALTKTDLADPGKAGETAAEVRAELAGTALAQAPIVPVSAATGAGMERLVATLLEVLATAPAPADHDRPRLWVDRSFSIRGAGTVVTGTLGGGRLATGDELVVLPGRRGSRVRGLQALQAPVTEAPPGTRVAVNLSGIERTAVARGDALGRPGQWHSVRTLDAAVRALPGGVIGRRGAWHFHAGSAERVATVAPLAGSDITGEGYLRIELDRAVPLVAGDRFVLRDAGRRTTVGGGRILDADPQPRPRGTQARLQRLDALVARGRALDAGDVGALFALHVRERGVADLSRAAAVTGLTLPEARSGARAHRLLALGPAVVSPEAATDWTAAVDDALGAAHAAHPLDRVVPRDVATRAAIGAGCPRGLAGLFLDALTARGRVVGEGPGVRAPQHAVRLDPAQARARQGLIGALGEALFSPPALSQAAAAAGASAALVKELEAAGDLVRLGPDLAVPPATLDLAVARLRDAALSEGPLTAARAKEILGTTRKYALPLLEELDRRGHTRRLGDVREVLG